MKWFGRPKVAPDLLAGGDDLGTGQVPNGRLATVSFIGRELLMEGAYCEMGGRTCHYVLDGETTPMCGTQPGALYRWMSIWSAVPRDERCAGCEPLVGPRGDQRHGWVTRHDPLADLDELFRRSHAEEERQLRARPRASLKGLPRIDPNGSFSDPPFVLIEDPQINRLRGGEPNRVLNDVYAKNPSGKRWHRIYAVDHDYRYVTMGLSAYGRGFIFPCGGAGSEFEPRHDWRFAPTLLLAGVPPLDEICKSCAQSDRKYGKGKIDSTTRWDR